MLLGSVLEQAAKNSAVYGSKRITPQENVQLIEQMLQTLFYNLGLSNTHCEYHEKILPDLTRLFLLDWNLLIHYNKPLEIVWGLQNGFPN